MFSFQKVLMKVKRNFRRLITITLVVMITSSLLLFNDALNKKNISYADTTYSSSQLPIGSLITFGRLGNLDLVWRVCGYGTDCEADNTKGGAFLVLENWKDTYKGILYDLPHTNDPNSNRKAYGTNNWRNSTLRYWLNSSNVAADIDNSHENELTGNMMVYDPNPYGKDGFLHDFTDKEKSAIQLTHHKNAVITSTDTDIADEGNAAFYGSNYNLSSAPANYDTAYSQYSDDYVFCLNCKELYNAKTNTLGDGYYDNDKCYYLRDGNYYGSSSCLIVNNRGHFYTNTGELGKGGVIYSIGANSNSPYVPLYLRPALILDPDKDFIASSTPGYYELSLKTDISEVTVSGIEDKEYTGLENYQSPLETVDDGYYLTHNGNLLKEASKSGGSSSPLELGDIVTLGRLGGHELKWRVAGFGTNCEASPSSGNEQPFLILDNWLDSELNAYTSMCFDPVHTGDTEERNAYGSNNWGISTMRAWLNSDDLDGNITYVHGNPYNKNGFLYEFTDDEKNALCDVTHKSVVGNINLDTPDGGSEYHTFQCTTVSSSFQNYDFAYYQNSTDKVFLLNIKELCNAVTNNSGFVWNTSPNIYFLRDAAPNSTTGYNQSAIRIVDTATYFNVQSGTAKYADSYIRLRPAIMLSNSASLIETSEGSGEWTVGMNGDYYVTYSEDVTNCGTVTVTFHGINDYSGTIQKTYQINPKSIKINVTEYSPVQKAYDGTNDASFGGSSTLSKTVSGVNGETLNFTLQGTYDDADSDTFKTVTYTLKSFDSVSGGQGKTSNYSLSIDSENNSTETNTIIPKTISVDLSSEVASKGYDGDVKVKWSGSETKEIETDGVGEEKLKFTISGTYDDETFGSNKTVTYTINENSLSVSGGRKKASNYKVKIETGKDTNSSSEITAELIEESDFTINNLNDETYTGSPITKTITSTLGDGDYLISYENNTNVGKATITITGQGTYAGTITKEFNIVQKPVDVDDITVEVNDSLCVFSGSDIEPGDSLVTIKVNGVILSPSDYEITGYENNQNVTTTSSKAKIKIKLKGNYSSETKTVEFDINPLTLTDSNDFTIEEITDSFIYDGSEKIPSSIVVKWKENILTENDDYTVSITNNVDAGEAVVTVSGCGNFSGTKKAGFNIARRDLSTDCQIVSIINSEEFKGEQIKPETFIVKDSSNNNRELVKGFDYSIKSYGTNTNIGTNNGSIEIEGGGNYKGTVTLYFDIVAEKVDISKITATLDSSNVIFDGTPKTPSDKITVTLNGTPLTKDEDWEVIDGSWENNTNAGDGAKVKIKLIGTYSSDPVTITFSIKPKELDSSDFSFVGDGVATKNVTLKSEYTNDVPASEYEKLLVKYNDVTLNFTNAKFNGLQTDPMKFGAFSVTLSGLSISDSNYKLKDSFTSYEVDNTHGCLVDKIRPELVSAFVTISDGTYKTGELIYIELNFDKNISKNGTNPILEFASNVLKDGKIGTLDVDKYKASALYDSISGSKVKFKYEVKEGDYLPKGFTFNLLDLTNYESLSDENGNIVNVQSKTKKFSNVIILSKQGAFEELKTLIQGSDQNKEEEILNFLKEDDKTDLLFEDNGELKGKIGSEATSDDLREKVAQYLSNSDDLSLDDLSSLIDEIERAIRLKEFEDEAKSKLNDLVNPPSKEEVDDMMIKYQKLSANEKKNFNSDIKAKLEEFYYSNLTQDYKYKDSPSGEINEIEMFGIATRTSAALQDKAVKLKVDRITDNERINNLQNLVSSNAGGVVTSPQTERILAPYDITLLDIDDAPVTIPNEMVLCKIELPLSFYGKIINIYHKVDDNHLELAENKLIEKIDNKCLVYFDCDSFSPYFLTSDVVSVKAALDPESTEGTVSPLGLFLAESGSNKQFDFTKGGTTNRVDITLLKFNDSTNEFDLVQGINPINLYNTTKYILSNITSNMFITFKLSHDDNFKQSGGGSSGGGGGGGGGGGASPKPEEPIVPPVEPILPIEPDEEYDFTSYMKGYEDGTFGPQLNMTRAEAATIVARITEGFSEDEDFREDSKGYKDYNPRHWANNYIGFVTKKEIMSGDEKGFRPNDPITRGEFSKLIYKLMNLEYANLAIVKTFDDCKGQFYETYANALYSANILTGYEDGSFKGSNKITRTEAAIMINKATGRGVDKEKTLKAIKASKDFKEFKDVPSNRWFYLDDMMATVSYSLEKEIDETQSSDKK